MSKLPKATHQGVLKIGEKEIDCAVLEDGTRAISRNAVFRAFGRTKRGRAKDETRVPNMPSFIDAKNLQPFINNDLEGGLKQMEYLNFSGKPTAGYRAEVIPLMCDLYLSARAQGVLTKSQLPFAAASEILLRSFAKIGIIALIDEATGYQYDRDRKELETILEAYIAKELLPWTKRFPDEFYRQLFRLRGWQYSPLSVKRPKYVGKLTNQLIYQNLPPGVIEELQKKNPTIKPGYRQHRHHQFLTEDIGNPHLERHIASVTALMRASANWRTFERLFQRAFSDAPEQLELGFVDNMEY